MTEWRPIATAPRDGTVFDVWFAFDMDEQDRHFYCSPGTQRGTDWTWAGGKFRPSTGLIHMPTFIQPTHWMPLPEVPHDEA